MNVSYFEIGGKIVECNSTSIPSSSPSPSSFRGAPTLIPEGATPRNNIEAGGRKGDHTSTTVDDRHWGKHFAGMLGTGMVRVGIGVLLVPDPLPFADEIIAAAMVGVGSGLIMISKS